MRGTCVALRSDTGAREKEKPPPYMLIYADMCYRAETRSRDAYPYMSVYRAAAVSFAHTGMFGPCSHDPRFGVLKKSLLSAT